MRRLFLLIACCGILLGCYNTKLETIFHKENLDYKPLNQTRIGPQRSYENNESIHQIQNLAEPQLNTLNSEPKSLGKQIGENQDLYLSNDQTLLHTPSEELSTQLTIEEYIKSDFKEPELIEHDGMSIYYLALGDSLTRGVGDEEQKNGYTKRLADKIEQLSEVSYVYLDNRGKRGRRSDQLLALIHKGHYDNELENSNLITITIGGNDMMKVVKKNFFELKKSVFDQELEEFEKRYDQIIKEIRLRNNHVPIVLIGLYNPFSLITDEVSEFEIILEEWNNSMKDLAEKHVNACFVDVEDLFNNNAQLVYHTDFFHPNGYGYSMMTERIISIMQNCDIEENAESLILFGQEYASSE